VCMKGKFLALGGIVVALIVVGVFAGVYLSTYNNLVQLGESTDAQWAQIDTQLQRRYDLIPSVVNVSRAYINYEGSVLEEITRLRTQWAQAVQNGNVDEINNATGRLESSLSNLIVTFEAYPNLKASQVVQDLTVVLEGTENRIATERTRYNDAAKDYNIAIKAFPGNLFASGWGFEGRAYFQAKVGATEPPPVL
jgi:LemA protein